MHIVSFGASNLFFGGGETPKTLAQNQNKQTKIAQALYLILLNKTFLQIFRAGGQLVLRWWRDGFKFFIPNSIRKIPLIPSKKKEKKWNSAQNLKKFHRVKKETQTKRKFTPFFFWKKKKNKNGWRGNLFYFWSIWGRKGCLVRFVKTKKFFFPTGKNNHPIFVLFFWATIKMGGILGQRHLS